MYLILSVSEKFARDFVVEYVSYNEIVTRAESTSTDPRFAEYYYESDVSSKFITLFSFDA